MNQEMNIMIVEDEFIASKYLQSILEDLNYKNIYGAQSSYEAFEIVKNHKIDLIFMDLDIKGPLDGIQTSKIVNEEYFIPVIYVTAQNEVDVILDTLDTNVFGYIVKPFEKYRFVAPFKIALKKINEQKVKNQKERFDCEKECLINLSSGYKFNMSKNTCYLNNVPIKLTKKEIDLLKLLCININANVSYETIKSTLWNGSEVADSTLRDLVSRLKRKLPEVNIYNISNIGYLLKNIS